MKTDHPLMCFKSLTPSVLCSEIRHSLCIAAASRGSLPNVTYTLFMSPATTRCSSNTLLATLLLKGGCQQPTKFSTEMLFMKIFLYTPLCSLQAAVLSFLGRKPIKPPFCGDCHSNPRTMPMAQISFSPFFLN